MSDEFKYNERPADFSMMPFFGLDLGREPGSLDSRMGRLENDFQKLDSKVDRLDAKVERLDARVESLEVKVESLDAKVEKLDAKIGAVDAKLTGMIGAVDARVDKCNVVIVRLHESLKFYGAVSIGLLVALLAGFIFQVFK